MSAARGPGAQEQAAAEPGGLTFWLAAVVGLGVMAFGVRGILTHASATRPFDFATWFVGADLVHDLVIAPIVILVGAIATRALPAWCRPPVRAGLIATALVVAVAWAPLRGYGRATAVGNETVQPLNYATAVATVLGVVWATASAWLIIRLVRRARH